MAMELDNIKLDTTWNDAAGSINNNFSKIKLAISQGVGNSVEIDKEMSDTSENAVQNKVIKAYVDGKAAEAQAAAEQYIQDEVLTYYATTNYVEGLVKALEDDINSRGYLTSAAMNGYATKEDIKNFVTKGSTLDHYGITDAVKNGGYFTPDASSPTMGFATTANGWPYHGAAMMIGTKGAGQLRLISTSGNSYIPEIFVSGRYLDNESEWARIITDKNLGSNAIVIDSNGGTLLPTDPKAKAAYVYGRNGWKVTGPAMIFPHGGHSGLFNFGMFNPQTNPNGSPSLFININYGGVLGQWAQVVTDKNFDTFGVKMGGRETTGSANDIETSSIVGYTNGMTDIPFTYGNLLTIASNPTYYVAQLAIRANGIFAYRARNDSKVWTDWKTVVDSSNVGDFTLPKTGGVITGALTVKANFQANANILIEAGSIKFLNQGNIEGVGAIIHKYAGAYNMDQYGNFYAASTATDSAWNFKRADGKDVFRIFAGTGTVETSYDTTLGRNGGSTGCTVNMGNAYNRANTNVYGDFKVIGYPAEFQNGITLGGETINSWDNLKIKVVEQTATSGISIAPNVLNRWTAALTGTLTINFNAGSTGVANYYMIEFKTGNTVPTISLPSEVKWEGGYNILNNLAANTTYQISILNNLAVGGAF